MGKKSCKIIFFDIATSTGWAVYDVSNTPSSIACGSVNLVGDGAFEKVKTARILIPPLFHEYGPDYYCLESPLAHIQSFEKKQKPDLLTGIMPEPDPKAKPARTMNPGTVLMLNRLHGAIQVICEGFKIPGEEVAPKTWQAIIPDKYRGDTKARARQFCDQLGIIGSNEDARDASVGSYWVANRSQKFKDFYYSSMEAKPK